MSELKEMTSFSGWKDYSECEEDTRSDLDGVTPKIVVWDGDIRKMLKFAKIKMGCERRDYVSEYVACKIAKALEYNVQEVELAFYRGRECVAIRMFDYDITTFDGFGPSTDSQETEYDLDALLHFPFKHSKFALTEPEFKQYVWNVFVLDMVLSNFDRHENNWGFQRKNGVYQPSGLFDLGGSLYSKWVIDCPEMSEQELEHLIEFDSRCAILFQGKKKNYWELMKVYAEDSFLGQAIRQLVQKACKIDLSTILDEVISYNEDYAKYCTFVSRMLQKKLEMLGGLYGDS